MKCLFKSLVAALITVSLSGNVLGMMAEKQILNQDVTVNEIDEEKLTWPREGCPSYTVIEDKPYKERITNIFDARNQGHKLDNNGFEFVDFSSNETLTEVMKGFLTPSASKENIDELRNIYAVHLKAAVEQWWVEKHPEDRGKVEWVPLYEGSGTLRDTSPEAQELEHKPEPAFPFTHLDYYSFDDAINFFKAQEKTQPKCKVDERISDKNAYEILYMANIWAPLNDICEGFPLAVVDTENLNEANLPQIRLVPPAYALEFGAESFLSRYLKASPDEINYYSLSLWKRGEMVIFSTVGTPHTAYSDGSGKVRNSIEVRGVLLRAKH